MKIGRVITGYLEENCYVISDEKTCLVIDPGDDYDKIEKEIAGKKVLAVLITHLHHDHIGALRHFLKKRSIKIFKKGNLEEKEYTIGNFTFTAIFTPGHSEDSVTYYFKDINTMFVGDFVFEGTVGRCDLPGGNEEKMKQSIEKLKTYPEDTRLLPGHYEETTIKDEIANNIYFK